MLVTSLSLYFITIVSLIQDIFPSMAFRTYLELYFLFLTPPGLMCFLGVLISNRFNPIYFFAAEILSVIFAVSLFANLFGGVHTARFLQPFQIASMLSLGLYIVGAAYLLIVRKESEIFAFALLRRDEASS